MLYKYMSHSLWLGSMLYYAHCPFLNCAKHAQWEFYPEVVRLVGKVWLNKNNHCATLCAAYIDRMKMPKLVLNAGGDEFFLPDNNYYFWNDLLAPKYLRYICIVRHCIEWQTQYIWPTTITLMIIVWWLLYWLGRPIAHQTESWKSCCNSMKFYCLILILFPNHHDHPPPPPPPQV